MQVLSSSAQVNDGPDDPAWIEFCQTNYKIDVAMIMISAMALIAVLFITYKVIKIIK